MNTQTRGSRALLATVLGSLLASLVLVGGPAGAGTDDPSGHTSGVAEAIDDSTASGGCVAAHGSVCSGSGVAINGSTSSGDAVAIDGSTASGCSTAIDGSTASGGVCDRDDHRAPEPKHRPQHQPRPGEAPEAHVASPTAAGNLTFTG